MKTPKVGVLLPTRAVLMQPEAPQDLDAILNMAQSIEEAGYDDVWVGDSLLASPRPEVLVTLAALAGRTRRIGIGSAILISSLRHPVHLAHQLATIDLVSRGRLTVGVGFSSGSDLWKLEHDVVGVDVRTRRSRSIEGIEVMRKLWGEGPTTHRGHFFDIGDVNLEPKPVQPGGPPIWIHGMRGEKTLRRVAERADGWINNISTATEFSENWGTVQRNAEEVGRDPTSFTACHYSTIRVESDGASAREQGREFMRAYYGGMDPDDIERIECCCYGTPEAVAETLREFVTAGAETLILRFASDDQREQLELCTTRLLPLVKAVPVRST
jgi:probable F420-dependent oxidoreductase